MAKFSCFTFCGHGLSSYQRSLAPQPSFQHFSAQYFDLRAAHICGKAPLDLCMHVCCVTVAAFVEELQHFSKQGGEGKTGGNGKEYSPGNSGKEKMKGEGKRRGGRGERMEEKMQRGSRWEEERKG